MLSPQSGCLLAPVDLGLIKEKAIWELAVRILKTSRLRSCVERLGQEEGQGRAQVCHLTPQWDQEKGEGQAHCRGKGRGVGVGTSAL